MKKITLLISKGVITDQWTKIILLLFFLLPGLFGHSKLMAGPGDSCVSAVYYSGYVETLLPFKNQTLQNKWYKLTANDSSLLLILANENDSVVNKVSVIVLWGNSCGSLSMLGTDTATSSLDSILEIDVAGLSPGATYYLQVIKSNNVSTKHYTILTRFSSSAIYTCMVGDCKDGLSPNGGFEDYRPFTPLGTSLYAGPNIKDGIGGRYACFWQSTNFTTPDLFNTSCTVAEAPYYIGACISTLTPVVGIPLNQFGSTATAFDGDGYGGLQIGSSAPGAAIANQQYEYITDSLKCSMVEGVTYDVILNIQLSSYATFAMDYMGVYISTDNPAYYTNSTTWRYCPSITAHLDRNIWDTRGPLANIPNGTNDEPYYFTPTSGTTPGFVEYTGGWYQLHVSYLAHGGEQFLTIGSFNNNLTNHGQRHLVTANETPPTAGSGTCVLPEGAAYYYVDGVSVLTTPPTLADVSIASGPLTVCNFHAGYNPVYTFNIPDGFEIVTANATYGTASVTSTNSIQITWGAASMDDCKDNEVITIKIAPGGDYTSCSCGYDFSFTIYQCCRSFADESENPNIGSGGGILNGASSTDYLDAVSEIMSNVGGNLPAGWASAGAPVSITGKTFNINGVFTVDNSLTLTECDIYLGPQAQIVVNNSASAAIELKIDGCHLHACCQMWQGILVNGGNTYPAEVEIDQSMIEDADSAVTSTIGGKYTIDGSVFNRNYKGVEMAYFLGPNPLSDYLVEGSVFTCRDFSALYSSLTPTTISTTIASLTSTEYGSSQYPAIPSDTPYPLLYSLNNTGVSTYPFTTMLSPLDAYRSLVGIEVRNIINDSPALQITDTDEDGDLNTFDYLDYGIRAIHSNLTVYNNIFINCYNDATVSPNTDCSGVWAWDAKEESFLLVVGNDPGTLPYAPNRFYECTFGVKSERYNNSINYNAFENNSYYVPDHHFAGVQVLNENTLTNEVAYNTMIQMKYGIFGEYLDNSYLNIHDNTINVDAAMDGGVGLPNVGILSLITSNSSTDIFTNHITMTNITTSPDYPAYGIWVAGTTASANDVEVNDITLVDEDCNTANPSMGIWMWYTDYGIVACNSIVNSGTGAVTQTNYTESNGIRNDGSQTTTIINNSTDYMASGMYSKDDNTSVIFQCNQIDNSYDGIYFDLAANLPDQVGTDGSGNVWNGAGTSINYDLDGVASTYFQWFWNTDNPTILSTLLFSTGWLDLQTSTTDACTSSVGIAGCSGIGTGGIGSSGRAPIITNWLQQREMMLGKIVRGGYTYDTLSTVHLLQDTIYAFSKLRQYDTLMHLQTADDSLYQNFYSYTQNRPIAQLQQVYEYIHDTASSSLGMAASLNEAISPQGTIEENTQLVNSIYLRKKIYESDARNGVGAHYVFDSAEYAQLYSVASQKCILGGSAVPEARILLWINFQEPRAMHHYGTHDTRQPISKSSAYKLYPNPNDGTMTIEYKIEGTDAALFSIYDISGRLVKELTLNATDKLVNIDAAALNAGVYYYTIKEGAKKVKTEKLVIVK